MGRLLAQPYRIKVKMMRRLASVSRNAFLSSSSSFHNTTTAFAITGSTANPLLANVQYAVRGEIVIKATDLEKRLKVCLFKQVPSHKLDLNCIQFYRKEKNYHSTMLFTATLVTHNNFFNNQSPSTEKFY